MDDKDLVVFTIRGLQSIRNRLVRAATDATDMISVLSDVLVEEERKATDEGGE